MAYRSVRIYHRAVFGANGLWGAFILDGADVLDGGGGGGVRMTLSNRTSPQEARKTNVPTLSPNRLFSLSTPTALASRVDTMGGVASQRVENVRRPTPGKLRRGMSATNSATA
jgi:hypothetical protein